MIKLKVRIEGLRELERALNDFSKATSRNILKRALTNAAKPIQAAAQARAPKRTGYLAKSIVIGTRLKKPRPMAGGLQRVQVDGGWRTVGGNYVRKNGQWRRRSSGGVVIYIGSTSSLAHFQEFGTAHHAPQPFMRPAWDAGSMQALGTIRQHLEIEVEKSRVRAARKALRAKRRS